MGSFDFDQYIERAGTGAIKYNGSPGIIPMWIADMDFKAPREVTEALIRLAGHGVFGYTEPGEAYDEAVCSWFSRNFQWRPAPEWIVKSPSVVFALAAAIRAFTAEGEAVIIQQPVYHPFMRIIADNNRRMVVNELRLENGRYEMDFDDFERRVIAEKVKLLILCSPHNPVGRVWERRELACLADICLRHGVYVVSDEIHCDFVYPGHRHTVFASLDEAVADITVTCTAATKTFNLAGLQAANTIIANEGLRAAFARECDKTGYHQPNMAGLAATEAAYRHGQGWRDSLLDYLRGNIDYLEQALAGTNIGVIKPQGTYLVWLDCRKLGVSAEALPDFFSQKARLRLHDGRIFGPGGAGFMRMNIACPQSTLKQALDNLKGAVLLR